MFIAIRLSRNGYGQPKEILEWDAEEVFAALEYDEFLSGYEAAFVEMNKESK